MEISNNLGPLTSKSFPLYINLLTKKHIELNQLVQEWGIPRFWARSPGFETLFRIILSQQISNSAAYVIHRRVKTDLVRISARTIDKAGEIKLRKLGLTKQKAYYSCQLAQSVLERRLSIRGLNSLSDSEVISVLCAQPGIGPWTSAVYLMAALKRIDVWPIGDLALRKGIERLFPQSNSSFLHNTGELWSPYRAVAARLIWHLYGCLGNKHK